MDLSVLTISPLYSLANTSGPITTIQDTTDYGSQGITNSQVKGNFTAKRGSLMFHDNDSYVTPDIDRGTTDEVSFFLPVVDPLIARPRVINGGYVYTYTIKVTDENLALSTVTAPGASPFTTLQMTSGSLAAVVAIVQNALSVGTNVQVEVFAGVTSLGLRALSSCSNGGLLTFASMTSGSFASVTTVKVYATMVYDKDFTYSFCDVTPVGCLEAPWECLRSQMTVKDVTVYPANLSQAITRTITLQFPRYSNGTPVDTTLITSAAILTIGPDIWTGAYTINLSSILNWTQNDGLLITDTWTAAKPTIVVCTNSMCNLRGCINSVRVKYQEAARQGSQYAAELKEQNERVTYYWRDYTLALSCSDATGAQAILNELGDYLRTQCGCDCGCSDPGSGEPMLIPATITSSVTTNLLMWS